MIPFIIFLIGFIIALFIVWLQSAPMPGRGEDDGYGDYPYPLEKNVRK